MEILDEQQTAAAYEAPTAMDAGNFTSATNGSKSDDRADDTQYYD